VSILLIGGGGHAKVVIGAMRAAGHAVAVVYDTTPEKAGSRCAGVEIRPFAELRLESGSQAFLAIGDNRARRQHDQTLRADWPVVIHPSAWVDPSARLAPGVLVCAGAVIQADASIGRHAIVNTGASVDHDCVLGDYVHVAPGARLGGAVRVGEGALLGVGSAFLPGVSVGAWSTVGVGAAVVGDVPEGVVARGVPARWR
jgi:sugar O-acyltransferase (sialic acid O-acetyltransferase NeuD family)